MTRVSEIVGLILSIIGGGIIYSGIYVELGLVIGGIGCLLLMRSNWSKEVDR